MPKRRNLNGIPHNITQIFFGRDGYYGRGYMGDWLLNAARRLNLKKASLNVLTATFTPEELNIRPLTMNAATLKEIINKELMANGFATDFIVEAYIDFEFPDQRLYRATIYCYPYLIDKNGKRYQGKRVIGEGLEPDFDPFDEKNIYPARQRPTNFIDKIKSW